MNSGSFSDESDTPTSSDNPEVEYKFEGYDIVSSEKVALTPPEGVNHAPARPVAGG
jgi:hypothetical protein